MEFAWRLVVVIALPLVVGLGCRDGSNATSDKLAVAVSVAPQAWLVEQIAGDRADVLTVVEPGQSPHTYSPAEAQVSRLMRSAVYFRVGVPFEDGQWFHALQAMGKVPVVDMRRGITLRELPFHVHHDEHEHGEHVHDDDGHDDHSHDNHGHDDHTHHASEQDPHIWLSPRLLKVQAQVVAETLSEIDPEHQSEYEANLKAFCQRVDEVDAALRKKLKPFAGRSFFVFHPAWGYFADEYGLKQVPVEIQGKEPSDQEMTALQQQARAAQATVVFVQPQISSRSAEAVAQAIGGRVETLDPLAGDVLANLQKVADALCKAMQPNGSPQVTQPARADQ